MAGRKKKNPTARDLLRAIPHQNARIGVECIDGGRAIVSVPIRRPGWLVPPISWMIPFRTQKRFELDALGAAVLNMCDGKANVESIVNLFARTQGLSFREAHVSVVQFLKMLTQRGVIAIVVGEDC